MGGLCPTPLLALLVVLGGARAWDNIALGKDMQRYATSSQNWQPEPSVTDGKVDTCPRWGSTNYRLNLNQDSAFSWIRIVGNSPVSQVQVRTPVCPSTARTVVSGNVQDWICPGGVTASDVDFASTAAVVICEVQVAKVSFANVALGKTASQSSTFNGTDVYQRPALTFTAAAGLAVDGAPTKNYADKTCAVTDWLNADASTLDPWWQVDLGNPYDVIGVDIYGRDAAKYPGLSVLVGSQPITGQGDPKTLLRGVMSSYVRASSVRISLSGSGILQLCEVEVFAVRACPGNTFGENCDRSCSATCLNGECNVFSGDCLQGCVAGYSGADCTLDIDDCVGDPCKYGTCQDGINNFTCLCQAGFQGSTCSQACGNWTFGVNCRERCGDGCRGECHVVTGNCSEGCHVGWTGASCKDDINECESSPCQNEAACQNLPGSFQCACPPGFSGQLCQNDTDECASNPCRFGLCRDHMNSYSCVCLAGLSGANCDQLSESSTDGYTSGLGLGLGIGLALLLLLSLVCLFLFLRHRAASSRRATLPQAMEMTPRDSVPVGNPGPAAAAIAMEIEGSPRQHSEETTDNWYERINDYERLDDASRQGVTLRQYESVEAGARSDGDCDSYLEPVALPHASQHASTQSRPSGGQVDTPPPRHRQSSLGSPYQNCSADDA